MRERTCACASRGRRPSEAAAPPDRRRKPPARPLAEGFIELVEIPAPGRAAAAARAFSAGNGYVPGLIVDRIL
ncbi:MAG: hypothetical protein QM699_04800 [Amaricoccus sp.]|uniref:hypothetical protein n=1 Tax=Amaricoccus sp. TaxID=1872485 RepID=UPI0039E5D1CB